MDDMLWKRDTWSNPSIPFLFNRNIIEYDIKQAGFSITKEYELLPASKIQKLAVMKEMDVKVRLGILQRDDKSFRDALSEGFQTARREFFAQNGLEADNILSIKKDAIFTIRECKKEHVGRYIHFRPKHQYSSYMKVGKRKMELYHKSDGTIDVKGISDELVAVHEEGMLQFFRDFIKRMEQGDTTNTIRFLRSTIDAYKAFELPVDYYREFNAKSEYVTLAGERFDDYWEEEKSNLDISYNYFILCNLAKILI